MTRHAVRRGSKLLVAATIAAAAASIVPAHAIIGTPVMLGNSVPNGYTRTPLGVAATYGSVVDPLNSTVTVTDVNGTPVPGSTIVQAGSEKTLVFQTTQAGRFNEDLSPYTATFTVRARNQAAATPSALATLTFDVDFVTPFPPDVKLNDGAPVAVVGAEDALTLSGRAADIVPESGISSGLLKLDLHFYNPAANPTQVTPAGAPEVMSMHRTVTFDCTGGCETAKLLTIDVASLAKVPAGYWNLKVSVTDAAGNQSAQSAPMAFLKVATPS